MSFRNWVVEKLNKEESDYAEIESASAFGDFLIEVKTIRAKHIIVGVIESEHITELDANLVCDGAPKAPNLLIARSNALWTGNAINYCRHRNIGWGGMGQIFSTFETNNYSRIQKNEYAFVEDGLQRHHAVSRLDRLYDRVFKITRKGNLRPLTIVLIDSYELTGEEIRNAITRYGRFDAVLKTNPNGDPTSHAYTAAAEIGADIFVWKELWGRLNKK